MPELCGHILHQSELDERRARVCSYLLGASYIFAKTMPENPHWYTLRKTWRDDAAFVETVEFMQTVGYTEIFKGRKYTMFNLNGYKYWTMGAPINKANGEWCTILINRAKIHEPADYDLIADRYDQMFADGESHDENLEVFNLLAADETKRILDIGCGTGLFLEYHTPDHYVGIDPSNKMLAELAKRHPNYSQSLVETRFEDFHDTEGFDLIISLFGSVNYIRPKTWPRVLSLLKPGGRVFAMFYQERYLPVTYEKAGVAFPHHLTSEFDLSGYSQTDHRRTFTIAQYTRPE